MIAEKRPWGQLIEIILLAVFLFTACASGASKESEKIELGQKYLTELNYTEAVAAFTEVVKIDPSNIEAYAGRAEAYKGLKQYDDAKTDYTTVIEKADDLPYTQAKAYAGRAEVYELTDDTAAAESDCSVAIELLDQEDVGKKENAAEKLIRELKIKVLQFHAEVCMKLGLYDKAMGDYSSLTELGVDVSAEKEKCLEKQNVLDEKHNGKLPDKTKIIDIINAARVENGLNRLTEGAEATASAQGMLEAHKQYSSGQIDEETRNAIWNTYKFNGCVGTSQEIDSTAIMKWKEDGNTASSYIIVYGEGTTIGVAVDWVSDEVFYIIIVTL